VYKSFNAKPWDYGYTYEILKLRLVEQYEYFKVSNIAEGNDYVASRIKLALNLYDIMMGDNPAGHIEFSDPKSIIPENPKYVSTKYVNTNNANRFVDCEDINIIQEFIYEEKAHRLFWRIMLENSRQWWD
jgi:hypothetical protein